MRLKVLRNKEAKSILFRFILVQFFIIVLLLIWSNINKKLIIEDIVNSKIEIAAVILENNPELEYEIGNIVTGNPTEEEFNNAKEILKKQGYDYSIGTHLDNTLKNVERRTTAIFMIITIISILVGIAILYRELQKIYSKVSKANEYIDDVLRGTLNNELDYEGEGYFPTLANELNKMVSVIKKDNEIIVKEKENMKEFLTDISHQLKTPLTSITMITDLLISKKNISKEKQMEFLSNIEVQSDRMNWLIYNLLKIARLDAGTIELVKEKVNINEFFKSIEESLKVLMNERKVKINIEESNISFNCDRKWTAEAIGNIVKNSIEHSNEGGRVDITIEDTLVYTRIIIKDYGNGISKEDLPNVFKRFYSRKTDGNSKNNIGVGLSMAKSIIEKQDGYVTVKSEEGRGTIFEITFIKS